MIAINDSPVKMSNTDLDSLRLALSRSGLPAPAGPSALHAVFQGSFDLAGPYDIAEREDVASPQGDAVDPSPWTDAISETELRLARSLQLSHQPRVHPQIAGWHIDTKYQPARSVGGDFYDLIAFDDGCIGVVMGDVTGKGMTAARIMASTRSTLRTLAVQHARPSDVLANANHALLRNIPAGYFVTCIYAVLNPATGHMTLANAGHNPPFVRRPTSGQHAGTTPAQVTDREELAADSPKSVHVEMIDVVGLPLGLMEDIRYDEVDANVGPGECVLFYSDGITEAHNAERVLFGFDRLQALIATLDPTDCPSVLDALLTSLSAFTGLAGEQEDDISLLALHRL